MVNKWDVYFCCLDPTRGSEQQGTRPVIVISNNSVNHHLSVSTVIPLSSVKENDRIYPTEIILSTIESGLPKLSVAMMQQIRTVSHDRFVNKVSSIVNKDTQKKILHVCREYFDL